MLHQRVLWMISTNVRQNFMKHHNFNAANITSGAFPISIIIFYLLNHITPYFNSFVWFIDKPWFVIYHASMVFKFFAQCDQGLYAPISPFPSVAEVIYMHAHGVSNDTQRRAIILYMTTNMCYKSSNSLWSKWWFKMLDDLLLTTDELFYSWNLITKHVPIYHRLDIKKYSARNLFSFSPFVQVS